MTQPMPSAARASRNGEALKIDIVVHGRFHGFALARALLDLGHDVVVHTNYPGFIVERFGVARRRVRSFVGHAVMARTAQRFQRFLPSEGADRLLHTTFGRWAARSVRQDADLVYGLSGVMEEYLRTPRQRHQLRVLSRGSAHIREQAEILADEEARVGVPLDRPSAWMIAREEREYAIADRISVLSEFARASFLRREVEADKCTIEALGVDVAQFRASGAGLAEREQRILTRAPLRVLNVGTFSFRKGISEQSQVAAAMSDRMKFRFVGDRPPEGAHVQRQAAAHIEFFDRVAEQVLTEHYAWADIFLFPTLEDGFAAVLLQAAAAGLPIVATANCAAPDFVVEGSTGWIVPIRAPQAIIERLRWCDANRTALAGMVSAAARSEHTRDWSMMAAELVALWQRHNARRTAA